MTNILEILCRVNYSIKFVLTYLKTNVFDFTRDIENNLWVDINDQQVLESFTKYRQIIQRLRASIVLHQKGEWK